MAKLHGAKKYISRFSTAHKGIYQSSSRSARMNNKMVNMCSMRQLTGLMPTTSVLNMTVPACFPDGLEPPYAGSLMQVILVSVL